MVSQEKRLVAGAIEKFLAQEAESSEYPSEQIESLQGRLNFEEYIFILFSCPSVHSTRL